MRLALITDIHEDLPSLKAIIKKAEQVGYDQMICLGDICGFSHPYYTYRDRRDASACLSLVRNTCSLIIPGNHDLHAAGKIPEHSRIFDFPENWYELDAASRESLAEGRLWTHADDLYPGYSQEDLSFIRDLPEFDILETEKHRLMFSHYAYPNLSGFGSDFFAYAKEFGSHFQWMDSKGCSMAFIGHAHPRRYFIAREMDILYPRHRRNIHLDAPSLVALPPVTRNRWRSGFCTFDTETLKIRMH